ncbi:MAG: hypothetical protein ACM3ZE_21120, partial [Myxococcales bacterium]
MRQLVRTLELAVTPFDSFHDGPRERDDGVDFAHELLVKWAVHAPSDAVFVTAASRVPKCSACAGKKSASLFHAQPTNHS